MTRPQIFLDCDGVLADFDRGARFVLEMCPREFEGRYGSKTFWNELRAEKGFYRNLPLMPGAEELVEAVRHLQPIILTGVPLGGWAESQKLLWAQDHFPDVPLKTCRSKDKCNEAEPGDVLIDDWPQHRHHWIAAGGIFISHYDAKTSLDTLWAHYPELKA